MSFIHLKKYYIDHLLRDRGTRRPMKETAVKNSCRAGKVLGERVAQKASPTLPGWVRVASQRRSYSFEMGVGGVCWKAKIVLYKRNSKSTLSFKKIFFKPQIALHGWNIGCVFER